MLNIFAVKNENRTIYEELLPEDLRGQEDLLIAAGEVDADGRFSVKGIGAFLYVESGAWELAYIHVASDDRGHGLGGQIIEYGAFLIGTFGGYELLATYIEDKDTEDLKRCLLDQHFSLESSSPVNMASIDEFAHGILKLFDGAKPTGATPLSRVTDTQWEMLLDKIDEQRENDDGGVYPELMSKEEYHQDLSMFSIGENGSVKGVLLVEEINGELAIDYLMAKKRAGFVIGELLYGAVEAAVKEYAGSTIVRYHAFNPIAEELVNKILNKKPGDAGMAVTYMRNL